MKTRFGFLALLAALAPASLLGQTGQQALCTTGAVIYGAPCSPVSGAVGSVIKQIGLTAAMPSTNVCSTATCPAGLYSIHGYVVVTSAATVGTAQVTISYTDDAGPATVNVGPSVSLTGVGRVPIQATIELNGTSGLNVATTTLSLTGALTYNLYLTAVQLKGF